MNDIIEVVRYEFCDVYFVVKWWFIVGIEKCEGGEGNWLYVDCYGVVKCDL